MKGMIVEIYKSHLGDCSNFGISSKYHEVLVMGEGIPELTEDDGKIPVVVIRRMTYAGEKYIIAEPNEFPKQGHIGWMAGGCFIWSCDSRFRENISEQPVPLHDRQEAQSREDK